MATCVHSHIRSYFEPMHGPCMHAHVWLFATVFKSTCNMQYIYIYIYIRSLVGVADPSVRRKGLVTAVSCTCTILLKTGASNQIAAFSNILMTFASVFVAREKKRFRLAMKSEVSSLHGVLFCIMMKC